MLSDEHESVSGFSRNSSLLVNKKFRRKLADLSHCRSARHELAASYRKLGGKESRSVLLPSGIGTAAKKSRPREGKLVIFRRSRVKHSLKSVNYGTATRIRGIMHVQFSGDYLNDN